VAVIAQQCQCLDDDFIAVDRFVAARADDVDRVVSAQAQVNRREALEVDAKGEAIDALGRDTDRGEPLGDFVGDRVDTRRAAADVAEQAGFQGRRRSGFAGARLAEDSGAAGRDDERAVPCQSGGEAVGDDVTGEHDIGLEAAQDRAELRYAREE